jgi:hypothetical protein
MGSGGSSLGLKRPGCESDHSHPPSAEVNNAWSYTSAPKYVFMAWCLVKHRSRRVPGRYMCSDSFRECNTVQWKESKLQHSPKLNSGSSSAVSLVCFECFCRTHKTVSSDRGHNSLSFGPRAAADTSGQCSALQNSLSRQLHEVKAYSHCTDS